MSCTVPTMRRGRPCVVAEDRRLLVDPADAAVGADDAVLEVVGHAAGDRRLAGGADRGAIVGVDELEERLRRSVELPDGHAEDPVRLRRPAEVIRAVELGHPAADVRDFLGLLEEGLVLRQRVGGADGGGDVAEARGAAGDARAEDERRDEALDDAAALEAQDVEARAGGSDQMPFDAAKASSALSSSAPILAMMWAKPPSASSAAVKPNISR